MTLDRVKELLDKIQEMGNDVLKDVSGMDSRMRAALLCGNALEIRSITEEAKELNKYSTYLLQISEALRVVAYYLMTKEES